MRFFPRFRFQSIFLKTVLAQLLLALGVVGMLFLSFRLVYLEQYEGQMTNAACEVLEVMSGSMDRELTALETKLSDLFRDEKCNRLIAEGSVNDAMLPIETAALLSKTNHYTSLAETISLYVDVEEIQVTSGKKILPYTVAEDADAFWAFRRRLDDTGRKDKLLEHEGSLYLFVPFPEERPLAYVCARISKQALWNTCIHDTAMEAGPGPYLYLDNTPLFPQQEEYPFDQDFLVTDYQELSEDLYSFRSSRTGEKLVALMSPVSRILYIFPLNQIRRTVDMRIFAVAGTLVLAGILLLLILTSYYLVRTVYRPISGLLKGMALQRRTGGSGLWDKAKDEIDLIRQTQQAEEQKEKELSSLLKKAGTEISEKLFESLLAGSYTSEGEILRAMEEINSPFPSDGEYVVLHIRLVYPETSEEDSLERKALALTLRSTCRAHFEDRLGCLFENSAGDLVLAAAARPSDDAKTPDGNASFRDKLARTVSSVSSELYMSCVHTQGGIFSLKEANTKAEEDLRRKMYYRQEGVQEIQGDLLREEIERAIKELEQSTTGQGDPLEPILAKYRDQEGYGAVLVRIRSILEERTLSLGSPVPEELLTGNDQHGGTPDEAGSLEQHISRLVSWIRVAAMHEQYRHIQEAKQFMESHHSDSSLSLLAVGEHCGISASYLSKLFSAYEPQGFLQTLNEYRIHHACRMLLASRDPVADIGYRAGFNSTQNFIRVFKKYTGVTPGQYRSQTLLGNEPHEK